MRATICNNRTSHLGAFTPRHNDRNFNISHAEHIDPERVKLNRYWNWTGKEITFEDAERTFYEKHIFVHLEAQNARYRAQRHAERAKTMDEYRKSPQTCPEEVILQIGKAGDTIPADMMARIIQEQINWEQKRFPQVRVLDVALHMDEPGAAPHIHERRAWVYTDKDGNLAISQNKALEQMGIELPNPDRPRGRFNNRKQVFSRMCREHLLQICREHGLEIEEIPQEKSRSGLSHIAYITRQEEEKAADAEHRRHISEQMALIAQHEQKQEKQRTMDYLTEQNRLKAKIRYLENEIEELEADHREIRFDVVLASNTLNDMIAEKNETYRKLSKSISELQKKEYEEQKRLEHLQTFLSHAEKRKLAHLYEKDNNDIER